MKHRPRLEEHSQREHRARNDLGAFGDPDHEGCSNRRSDIDAHGVGELAWSLTMLQRSGGRMALIAPCPWVRRLLALTRLDTILAIYDSEFDAITSGFADSMIAAASVSGLSSPPNRIAGND
jgi:hypothetical protein